MSLVSAKYALAASERKFILAHLGGLNATEAYRRAFKEDLADKATAKSKKAAGASWDAGVTPVTPIPNKEISRLAKNLLEQDHIQGFVKELEGEGGDHARRLLIEQAALKGDVRAGLAILDQEDKLGFRDAQELWAEVMCSIGCEVVVPLPGGGEVAFVLKEMFPKFAEALPPNDVLVKTMQSLDQYMWVQNHPDRENADVKDWKYGDGVDGRY